MELRGWMGFKINDQKLSKKQKKKKRRKINFNLNLSNTTSIYWSKKSHQQDSIIKSKYIQNFIKRCLYDQTYLTK
jgi:hypothetical protein